MHVISFVNVSNIVYFVKSLISILLIMVQLQNQLPSYESFITQKGIIKFHSVIILIMFRQREQNLHKQKILINKASKSYKKI